MEAAKPSSLDDFLFDLRGYLVIEQAAAPDLVTASGRGVTPRSGRRSQSSVLQVSLRLVLTRFGRGWRRR